MQFENNHIIPKGDEKHSNIKSWVFLSHSNLDYEKVIIVRNILEKYHRRPIMFFLKCVEEDKELDVLLKREIDARNQFILCDSENARRSRWVQLEVEYIKSKGRVYQTINLDTPPDIIEQTISEFVNRSKVFITHSYNNHDLALKVQELLCAKGFEIVSEIGHVSLDSSIVDSITNSLDSAAKEGYQVALLSKDFLNSKWCQAEVQYFLDHDHEKWLLPVIIDDTPHNSFIHFKSSGLTIEDVSMYDCIEEKAKRIVDLLIKKDYALSE